MRAVRDTAVKGSMTDAERRDAAARVAMQLFSMLGAMDDDDDGGADAE